MSEAAEFATRRSGLGAGESPTASCPQPSSPIPQFAALSSQHLTPGQGFSPEPSSQYLAPSRQAVGCELAAETLRSFGQLRLRVNGASMLPAVWPGDILTITRDAASPALPGDIVLFGRKGRLVAHRVVEVRNTQSGVRGPESEVLIPNPEPLTPGSPSIEFVTRGDSVEGNDQPISPNEC